MSNEPGSHRVQRDVAGNSEEVRFFLYQFRRETRLKQMTDAVVSAIERLCVGSVQLTHGERDISVGNLQQEMVVVAHQAIGVTEHIMLLGHGAEYGQQTPTIGVIPEDVSTLVSTRHYVVDATGDHETERPCHQRARWRPRDTTSIGIRVASGAGPTRIAVAMLKR